MAFSELATSTAGRRAAGDEFRRNGVAGDAARRLDDLSHAESLTVTKVVDEGVPDFGPLARAQRAPAGAHRPDRRRGCSRGCRCRRGRVVVAIDANRGAPSQGDVENQRDQVRFRARALRRGSRPRDPRRAGHVEVAQRSIAQPVNAIQPGQHLLHQQLGLAVGVGGQRRASS
jgi:hypothetical protein